MCFLAGDALEVVQISWCWRGVLGGGHSASPPERVEDMIDDAHGTGTSLDYSLIQWTTIEGANNPEVTTRSRGEEDQRRRPPDQGTRGICWNLYIRFLFNLHATV